MRPCGVDVTLSYSRNFFILLLVLTGAPPLFAADISDIKVPLGIKSRFIVRASEGPPADRVGLNRYAPCYLLKFTKLKYSRAFSFTEKGEYIRLMDFYGDYELPSTQTLRFDNYLDYRRQYAFNASWRGDMKQEFGKESKSENKGEVEIKLPWEPPKMVQSVIGEGQSNIKVSGSRSISFSGKSEWEDGLKETGTFKQSKFPTLQMQQTSRFKVTGTIGSKITVEVDQDSKRDVELANTIKLRYKGDEDEILQSIEAGNTNLALPNAQLIGYSQNVQGLFGIKASAKVGNLDLTMITSQEKGTSEKANFNAGAKGAEDYIRDYQYLANTYFWLDDFSHSIADTLIRVELYTNGSPTDPHGIATVNPGDTAHNLTPEELNRAEYEYTNFKLYENTFEIYRGSSWFISLSRPLQGGEFLGAYIIYTHYDSTSNSSDTIKFGNLDYRPSDSTQIDTSFILRLIKARNSRPSFTTWNRMWRNVYDLGAKNISSDGFELQIYKGVGGSSQNRLNDIESQNGHCFITLLALDKRNNTDQTAGADCIFDFDNTMIDAAKGYLIFPRQQPFNSDSLTEKLPEIYTMDQDNLRDSTIYYIYVKTSQRSSSFTLGRANIMPGSEVVKLGDGTILRRDVDYTINYDIGQITFLNDQALNPAANVTVDFEYAPFFMPEKKSLFGVAGQYRLRDNSSISMAAMYRSETASDPRPRVGREPRRGFVWDSNFNLNFKPDFMTSLVDALPFVEADAQSGIDISGEIAQSFPNPNLKDVAYIDDFEGIKNYTDLSTRRSIWTRASPPLDSNRVKLPVGQRGELWWYNPFQPLRITDIWPGREEGIKPQDDRIDVMVLNYFPDTSLAEPESSWAGIMRSFYTGLGNQSLSKYIEIWYLPDTFSTAEDPTLFIDLGSISEDIDDDQSFDSEDRQNTGSVGVFEPDEEDTGLDAVFNAQETGPLPAPDRNGDDWYYDPNVDPNDFARINGTEGNREDPDRRGRFDTEDINNNNALDQLNGYFQYEIHLNDSRFVVDATTSGWKLLRIPLQDSTVYRIRGDASSADFASIKFARLWLTASAPYQMAMATIELVGNKWQELEIAIPEGDVLRPDEKFEITIKNTHDNANYEPPPGIAGQLNRETKLREKEQSLVLAYQNMPAGHVGGGAWRLYEAENYTQYGRLKMYVHGDTAAQSGVDERKITFFMRMSSDQSANSFYEYHTVLEPGWAENNWVEIDFARMTDLKYELQRRTAPESLAFADTTAGNYRVYGNPALSQVIWFIVGVEIAGDATAEYTGEVWIDEMRVVDIRRNSDYAGRIQATARFSDFFDVSFSYNRTGADFFPLSAKVPMGATNVSKSARLGVRADKILPPSLGLSLPVSVSWQNTVALPRLKPGSDIILEKNAQEFEKTESKSYSYSLNQAFNRNTKNWIWNSTLNRIRTSYTYSRADGISPANPVSRRDSYKGTGAYDLTPKAKPSFKPFFWTKFLFLPKSIQNSQLFPLPTQLSFSGEVNGSKSASVNQRGIWTSTRVRDLSLTGNSAISLFSSLRSSYNLATTRDISRPGRFRLSIDPSKLKLGQEQTFQQRFETSYQPRLLSFIENRFSFNSSYTENSDLKRNPDSTRATQMTSALKADFTFNIQSLLSPRGRNKPPPSRKPEDMRNLQGLPGESEMPDMSEPEKKNIQQESEEPKEGGAGRGSPRWVAGKFMSLVRSIKPIRASHIKDKKFGIQNLVDRPYWQYMFGLAENPHARTKQSSGLGSPNQSVFSDNYQLESGLSPGRGLDISSSYSLRKTLTRSSTTPVFTHSTTFPDISVTLGQLEKVFLFKKFANTVSLQSSYSKKVDENGDANTDELYRRDTARDWSPFASLNIDFKNNVRATIRYDFGKTFQENLKDQGQSRRNSEVLRNTIKLSLQYNLTAPKGLKLPLLKRIKFNSQLSLNLDITKTNNKSQSFSGDSKSIDAHSSQITIEPRMTYQFSRAITGSIRARWDDSENKILKRKHHVRELGLSAEIRF